LCSAQKFCAGAGFARRRTGLAFVVRRPWARLGSGSTLGIQMKTLALTLCLAAVFTAPAAFAKPARGSAQTVRVASEPPLGRDGQDTRQVCSNQNPNIEYRDCVNASTRDPNAKIRMG
jgi:hypothetical protein